MKNIINAIRGAFRGKSYTARMIIAGQNITVPITAPDRRRALEEAERIVDDCGTLLDLIEA